MLELSLLGHWVVGSREICTENMKNTESAVNTIKYWEMVGNTEKDDARRFSAGRQKGEMVEETRG